MKVTFLEYFRGLAILWIVLYHILRVQFESYGEHTVFILNSGHLGVEIFFVISGYGISVSVDKVLSNDKSYWLFVKRRISRIYITYFFSIFFIAIIIPVISGLLSTLKGYPLTFNFFDYSFSQWFQIITLTKVFTAKSWWLSSAFLPLNGVIWFIAVLVQIYLIICIAVHFKTYYYRIVSLISFLSVCSFIPEIREFIPYGLFLPYWIEFAFGILLFYLIKNEHVLAIGSSYKFLVYFICFVLYGIISFIILNYTEFDTKVSFAFVTSLLFWLIYPIRNELENSKIFSVFSILGSFSYSLYLLHVPLWRFTEMIVRNVIPLPPFVYYPFIIIPSIILQCYLWYLFFEKPGTLKGSYYALRRPLRTIQSGTTTIFLKLL